MREARSIRFGGIYVTAEKCDRTSPLKMGLVCGLCGNPVRWVPSQEREAHERKLKGKDGEIRAVRVNEAKVESFFAHFEADPGSYRCQRQASVKKITPKEKKVGIEKFEKQSLAVFKAFFRQIMLRSPVWYGSEQEARFFLETTIQATRKRQETVMLILNGITAVFKKRGKAELGSLIKLLETLAPSVFELPEFAKYTGITSAIEQELQLKIAIQAMKYLFSRSGSDLANELLLFAVARETIYIASGQPDAILDIKQNLFAPISLDLSLTVLREFYNGGKYNFEEGDQEAKADGEYLKRHGINNVPTQTFKYKSAEWETTFQFAYRLICYGLLSCDWQKYWDAEATSMKEYRLKLAMLEQQQPGSCGVESPRAIALGLWHYTYVTKHCQYIPLFRLQSLSEESKQIAGKIRAALANRRGGMEERSHILVGKEMELTINIGDKVAEVQFLRPQGLGIEPGLLTYSLLFWGEYKDLDRIGDEARRLFESRVTNNAHIGNVADAITSLKAEASAFKMPMFATFFGDAILSSLGMEDPTSLLANLSGASPSSNQQRLKGIKEQMARLAQLEGLAGLVILDHVVHLVR